MEKLDAAVRQEIVRIVDQWVPEGDLSRDAALVMVAALFAGPSEVAIAEITGCPAEFVSVIAARLRASGVWTDAAVEYADWFAPGNLGIAHFTLDLETAAGTYVRSAKGSDGRYGYTLVAEGLDATRDEEWDGAGCPDPESSID